jgi:Tfp pilus assembly PilM family ATPase/Tfp pilus assembly protein PilN
MLSLNINNQNIRFLQTAGQRITRFGTIELPPGLVKDGNILNPEKVAAIITAGFTRQGVQAASAIVSMTGMSFIYRVLSLPPVKADLLTEALQRATQKEINVSLEELYLDWQIISENQKQTDIFVVGSPRTSVEALFRTLELAKIKIGAVDLNSLALARMVNQAEALIVNFEEDWFDISIISQGLPVTLHSAAPKGLQRDAVENVAQLAEEVRRTIDFFNLAHKEATIQTTTPIYIGGSLADNPEIKTLLASHLANPLQALKTSWVTPPGFSVEVYAVNLGLIAKAAAKKVSKNTTIYHNISIDLMAGRWRTLSVPIVWKKFLMPASIILFMVLLIPLMALQKQAASTTQQLNVELGRVNHNLNLRRMMLDENQATQVSIDALNTKIQVIQSDMRLLSGKGDLAVIMDTLTRDLPVDAEFVSIVSTANDITIEGLAGSRDSIIQYVQTLSGSGLFSEVRLAAIEAGNNPDPAAANYINFTVVLIR